MWAIAALALLSLLVFFERLIMFGIYFLRLLTAQRAGSTKLISSDDKLLRPVAIIH